MLRFLIIEDEMAAGTRLRRMVQTLRPGSECLAELRGVEDTLDWLTTHGQAEVDVAFMDIQLSDGISFDLFNVVEITFPVIFTTAYDHYALQVFQVHTIDYLLKPIKADQLSESLVKLDKFGGRQNPALLREALAKLPAPKQIQRFIVKTGRSIKIVNTAEISYFFSEHKITYLVCFDGRRFAIDQTLDQLEEGLDPADFFRANRQFIVCIRGIADMQAYSRSRLKLNLTPATRQEVIVSTEKTPGFKDWIRGIEG